VNDAPTLEFALADAQAIEDQPFALAIPAGTFSDVDAEDVLALSASLASGAPLPEWLSYDASTGMLSGTPENAHVGDLDIRVTATDAGGASTSDTFTVAVVNINDAPVVANPVADQTATEDSAFAYTVPENTFSDEDRGDALTWFASRADGSELPAWLSFDGFNRAFSGAPANEDVGSVEVRVAVHDGAGEAAADTFRIEVANVNDAPKLQTPLSDLHTTEDQAFTFALPAETFSDVDKGDTLAYTAARADGSLLPAWLQFADGTFSGTPRNPDVGSYDFRVSAADSARVVVSDLFRLDVANVNDAPTVANPLDDRSFEAGSAFSFTVPANTFADEDVGDALTLTAGLYGGAALPSWLQFDPATGTFTGNPGKKENGILRVVLTAADLAGAAASTDFGLVVRAKTGSTVTGGKGDDVMYGGTGNETLIAKGGNDALFGGEGNDMMSGGNGEDLLQGGEGADMLHGGSGNNLLDGGSGDDVIFGGRGASLIAGGTGNDLIRTGSGSDVILFNRGDGIDTVFSDRAGDNTLSFGGGIRYSDLRLSKTGKDLVVDAGADDRIVLKDWYNGKRSVLNLQIVAEASADFDADSADPLRNRRVQTFDFLGLVSSFDQARKASPGLTSWDLTNALLQFHLSGADDLALGGDLAYWYAKSRGFGGISLAAAQEVIGAPGFGQDAQTLRSFSGLQEGFVKLS
jgi:Ca2+-binding RTX toxin-like protein